MVLITPRGDQSHSSAPDHMAGLKMTAKFKTSNLLPLSVFCVLYDIGFLGGKYSYISFPNFPVSAVQWVPKVGVLWQSPLCPPLWVVISGD